MGGVHRRLPGYPDGRCMGDVHHHLPGCGRCMGGVHRRLPGYPDGHYTDGVRCRLRDSGLD